MDPDRKSKKKCQAEYDDCAAKEAGHKHGRDLKTVTQSR